MRIRFKSRTGYERWADIEEVTMLIQLDGTVVTSLPDTYCNERLVITPGFDSYHAQVRIMRCQ